MIQPSEAYFSGSEGIRLMVMGKACIDEKGNVWTFEDGVFLVNGFYDFGYSNPMEHTFKLA